MPVREKCPREMYISFQKPKTIHPPAMVKISSVWDILNAWDASEKTVVCMIIYPPEN